MQVHFHTTVMVKYNGRKMIRRICFYPTLAYCAIESKFGNRPWYHRIDETVILGALPFRSITQNLLAENVRVVISIAEPYEMRFCVNTPEVDVFSNGTSMV